MSIKIPISPIIALPQNNHYIQNQRLIAKSSINYDNKGLELKEIHWQIGGDVSFLNCQNYIKEFKNKVDNDSIFLELEPKKDYYVRVKYIFQNNDESCWSDIIYFETDCDKLHTPTILSPINRSEVLTDNVVLSDSRLKLSKINDVFVSSMWQISLDSKFTNIIYKFTHDDSDKKTLTIEKLEPNAVYYVRVKHISKLMESDWSDVVSFKTKDKYYPINEFSILYGNNSNDYNLDTEQILFSPNNQFLAVLLTRKYKNKLFNYVIDVYEKVNNQYIFTDNVVETKTDFTDTISPNEYSIKFSKDSKSLYIKQVNSLTKQGIAVIHDYKDNHWTNQMTIINPDHTVIENAFSLEENDEKRLSTYGKIISISPDNKRAAVLAIEETTNSRSVLILEKKLNKWSIKNTIQKVDNETHISVFGKIVSVSNDWNYLAILEKEYLTNKETIRMYC